ncbi:MAG: fatty acyl-AMP ligase [Pikeienuella sp.]
MAAPTESGLPFRLADFDTFVEALDYAATGATGMTYYNAKGEVVDLLPYADLAADARNVAARLLAAGLVPGDHVALLAETNADFARTFCGCLYAGLVPAPLPLPVAFGDRSAYNDQLARIVDVAKARAVFTGDEYADWVKEAMTPFDLAYVGPLADLPNDAAPIDHVKPNRDALAYLQFSSGTTGAPKGVAVTHGSMMANLHAIAKYGLKLKEGDRGISWLPLYHDMGLVGCFLTPIATQFSADYIATKDFVRRPLLWLELMHRNRGTITYAPSFGYDLAMRRARGKAPEGMDLSSWRAAGIGGDMIKAPIIRAFSEVFADAGFKASSFVPSYGMAETTLALSFAPEGQGLRTERLDLMALERDMVAKAPTGDGPARDFALCGPALADHKIEVRDEDGTPLPEGRVGKIFAAGPSLMREYFGDPEQTAACLKDGWLDTGDLGFFLEGQIVITGRAKDLMIVHGRNLWPQDLEWTIEKQVDAVREHGAAAFSVTPDDTGKTVEEKVIVVVECRLRNDEDREALRKQVHGAVREIHGVEAIVMLAGNNTLPKTSSGKLSRAKARVMYLEGAFA